MGENVTAAGLLHVLIKETEDECGKVKAISRVLFHIQCEMDDYEASAYPRSSLFFGKLGNRSSMEGAHSLENAFFVSPPNFDCGHSCQHGLNPNRAT